MEQDNREQGQGSSGQSGQGQGGGNKNKGFASMSEKERRRIASEGGKAAHEKGTAHEFTSEEARAAAQKRRERNEAGMSSGSDEDDWME